jgi:hypothetical protein
MKNTGRVALVVSAIAFVCWVLVGGLAQLFDWG